MISPDPGDSGALPTSREGRRTQKERFADTNQRVLDAATRVIARGGVRAATLAAVGEESGFSRGIVNHHFGTRHHLIETLATDMQLHVELAPPDLPGIERIIYQVQAYFHALTTRPHESLVFYMLWAEAVAGDRELSRIFAVRDAYLRQILEDCLRAGHDDGTIRSDADPAITAMAIAGQLRGIAVQALMSSEAPELADIREQVVTGLRLALTAA